MGTLEERSEVGQEYAVNPKEREILEQQNLTSVIEREFEGKQTMEMKDSPIESLGRAENEDVEINDEEEEINDEEEGMNDEGEMEDEDQMEDDHEYSFEKEYEDDLENVSLM